MKLAVLVPVHNGLDFTRNCIENIGRLTSGITEPGFEVSTVIVDDGSTDGTGEWLKENVENLEVLKGDGNLWWSGGINEGMKYAFGVLKADYVLWWNNDIEANPGYFKNLVSHIKETGEDIILGSKIYIKSNKKVWSMGGYFDPVSGNKGMYGFQEDDGPQFEKTFEADWLPGMGTCFSSKVYASTGLIDSKNFPQYHGDVEYTLRARKLGFTIRVFPDLILMNDKSNSGVNHNDNFRKLWITLTSLRSNYNLKKDLLFYRKFSSSPRAYRQLFRKYFVYVGGFIKWKILGLFGKKRKSLA